MNWLKKLWKFIKDPTNRTVVLFVGIILLFILLLGQCSRVNNLKDQLSFSKQNIEALNDTIKKVKNKAGEWQQEKLAYISTKKELEKLNKELSEELKKQKGDVIYISNLYAVLKSDYDKLYKENKTLKDSLSQYVTADGDTANALNWDFSKQYDKNNYRVIKGKTKFYVDKKGQIYSLGSDLIDYEMAFNLTTGLKEQRIDGEKRLVIFVKSNYPDLTFTNIEGAIVDPKKSDVLKSLIKQNKVVIGPQLGVGVGYDGKAFRPMVYVGVGVQYRLFGF